MYDPVRRPFVETMGRENFAAKKLLDNNILIFEYAVI